MAVSSSFLIRLSAISAFAGGACRFIAAFIPWVEGSAALEAFYLITDVFLLFGLMGLYLARAVRMGSLALVGFVVAFIGQAAIVGPDHQPFGIDVYGLAVMLIASGLVVFSVEMVRTRTYPIWIALCWFASPLVHLSFQLMGETGFGWGYFGAGLLFALGFMGGGWSLLRQVPAVPHPD